MITRCDSKVGRPLYTLHWGGRSALHALLYVTRVTDSLQVCLQVVKEHPAVVPLIMGQGCHLVLHKAFTYQSVNSVEKDVSPRRVRWPTPSPRPIT